MERKLIYSRVHNNFLHVVLPSIRFHPVQTKLYYFVHSRIFLDRKRQMNRMEKLNGEVYDNGAVFREGHVNATGLQGWENVALGPSNSRYKERRVVELDQLGP